MGEVIAVVSGKGGVGKTTAVANIGAALAGYNNRVLLIDADMGLRNLDIALGVESSVVYDIADVLDGVCDIETAIVPIENRSELYFLSSPQTRSSKSVTPERFAAFCQEIKDKYDYILIDGPAGVGDGFLRVIKGADRVIVVTQGYMPSLRDADRTIDVLEREGIKEISVLINSMRPDLVEREIMLDADYILDILGTKLLGIIPEDILIIEAASAGDLVMDIDIAFAKKAFSNISKRIMGEQIPIMDFTGMLDVTQPKKKFRWFFQKKNK